MPGRKLFLATATLALLAGTTAASEVEALIQAGAKRGGLCLLIGATDLALAADLAGTDGFYVHVIQPDPKLAMTWGSKVAVADYRENIGIRNAEFDAEHYGNDLFNIIIVEHSTPSENAPLTDLYRILVPQGIVAFRKTALGTEIEAKKLGMTSVSSEAFQQAFQKPLKPVTWQVCDSLKWRAGPRTQHSRGFSDFVIRNGTISYLEMMEVPGDIQSTHAQTFVRDAYNGRVLSTGKLSKDPPKWNPVSLSKSIAGRECIPDPAKKSHWSGGCYKAARLGKYILSHHNLWDHTETKERVFPYLVHPACFVGPIPSNASGLVYNLPSRKSSVISGITAIGPADLKITHEPGGKLLQKCSEAPISQPTDSSDWPMFRANPQRGNFAATDIGSKPVKVWEVPVGRGGRSYGIMSSVRTGLTQPVSAWGMVIVADIDAQRIVALDAEDGKQKWVYHVGSRVDHSPSLYKGLCIFAAKDGWVYALNAQNGQLCYRLLVAPRERYLGGQEKLESLWATKSDVLIHNGVGYASAGHGLAVLGGVRAVAFKPESGEIIWTQCYHAPLSRSNRQVCANLFTFNPERKRLLMGTLTIDPATGKSGRSVSNGTGVLNTKASSVEDCMAFGNSLSRNAEPRSHYKITDGRVKGRVVSFSEDLSAAFTIGKDTQGVGRRNYGGDLNLVAAKDSDSHLWESPPIELVVDDLLLTPKHLYCVGHYERVKKLPELWVVSTEDGKVLNKVAVDGFPAFFGMSAAHGRIFIATREGKLICLKSN